MAEYGKAQLRVDSAKGVGNIEDSLSKAEKARESQQRTSKGLGLFGKVLGFGVGTLLPGVGIPLAVALGGLVGRTVGDLSSNAEDMKVSAGDMSHLFSRDVKNYNRELSSFDKNENAASFIEIGKDLMQGYSLSSAGAGDVFKESGIGKSLGKTLDFDIRFFDFDFTDMLKKY